MADSSKKKDPPTAGLDALGDMSPEEFRRHAHRLVDWIADYLSNPERYPVFSQVKPGYLKRALPEAAPEKGEEMEEVLADLERLIVPGLTHWNHPAFFAYFAISGSAPGILGELLSAAFNINAMLWRTSPSATELEEVTLEWLRKLIGLPEQFSGVIYDTASISSLCAIAAAREAVGELSVRVEGLAGARESKALADPVRLRLYTSEHAHSSIEKAAITLGLGQNGVRRIPTDKDFRMDAAALARAINEDRAGGWRPFCVVATVGTTSTTSIDPVPAIAEICNHENLWLHVDAAYGGSAAVVPEMKWVMEGCDRAESVVVNPHKWLFVPVDLSALFCSRIEVLRSAFSLVPEYLRSSEPEEVVNFMDYGPQLGRRFRALKLWFVLRYFGAEGIASRVRRHIALAQEFANWVDRSPEFERMAPVPLSAVCFRARPSNLKSRQTTAESTRSASEPAEIEAYLDVLNERLLERVNREGKVFLSHTKLNGKFTLRLAIGNIRTTRDHVKLAWEQLNSALSELQTQMRPAEVKGD